MCTVMGNIFNIVVLLDQVVMDPDRLCMMSSRDVDYPRVESNILCVTF